MHSKAPLSHTGFDFDQWMNLARDHPETFERVRLEAIEAYFDQIPPQRQSLLRHLQWRIDMEIQRSRTPLAGCLRIHQMMMESLDRQKTAVDELLGMHPESSKPRTTKTGSVIPFKRRNHS